MRLHINDNHISAGRATQERIEPEQTAARLVERGYRPVLALAIAHGELSSPTGARRVARLAGLTTVETAQARTKGLLQ